MATASNAFPIPSDEYINESPDAPPGRIAIIGAACRFPGADSPDRLAELLFDGREAIGPVAALRPAIAAGGIERAGLIAAPELFDPQFFGIAQREADQMDPQQRLALELAVEALEAAGLPRAGLAGSRTGVYLGISTYDYSRLQMRRGDGGELYAGTGNAFSIAANRISYWLNLAGPSMAVDTACSSSLTAVHLAVRALRAGEIDLALVGGVGLLLSGELMQVFAGAGMLAPDGRCKTFDAAADGYVRGEGGGMVVLRRAAEAAAAGDRVLALIAGSAVNQDGRSNGLTAPSGPAQSAVLRAALADAGLAPAEVDAVELHGTGTPLGDPIEAQALGEVYAAGRAAPLAVGSIKTNIGHLEAAAGIAGLIKAALALAARRLPPSLNFSRPNPDIDLAALGLAVATEAVPLDPIGRPARVGVSSFGFGGSNAHVVLEAAALPPALPAASPGEPGGEWLLPLSAASPEALAAQAGRLAERLRTLDPAALADLVHTATLRRDHLDHRLAAFGPLPVLIEALAAAVAGRPHPALLLGRRPATGPRRLALLGGDEACAEALRHWGVKAVAETADAALAERLAGRWDLLCVESDWPAGLPERLARAELPAGPPRLALGARLYVLGHALDWAAQAPLGQLVALPAYPWQRRRCWFAPESPAARGVVFLIPGQGNPQPGAAAALYRDHAGFRAAIDRCAALLDELLDVPLATLLFDAERGGPLLRQTRYAQPAQFALGWALAQLWAGWGVRPAALAGHSLGEYVAAVLAGMAPLEQVLPLVARRGALMQETADGAAMLLVRAGAADVAALVEARPAELALAADNGPASCVLAGTAAAIEAAAAGLAGRGIRSRLLDVAAAFHSPLMEPIVLRLAGLAAMVDWQAGGVPAIANLHGRRHAGAPDAAYWAAHARGTVRYREGLEALLADGHRLFLELGPRPALATLGPTLAGGAEAQWLAALDGPGRDWPALAEAAAALRQAGVALDPACACDLAPHSPARPFRPPSPPLRARKPPCPPTRPRPMRPPACSRCAPTSSSRSPARWARRPSGCRSTSPSSRWAPTR
ncbi:type I polyketide synthase [Chitinimonas koreensis]|uniref:type I polyketide synthase n=1 Tax=Chitinimonas koreensis TaxID=356302 RepID=UPI0016542C39|nr:type I polyketide synthase [Chitinimonas koreensis]QNM94658.1 type I polyketide synthase [Chitinimonas koreensis]